MSETDAMKKLLPFDALKKMREDVAAAQLQKGTLILDFVKGQAKLKSEVVVTAPTTFSFTIDENGESKTQFNTDLKLSFTPELAEDREEDVNRLIFQTLFQDVLDRVG